MVEATRSGIPPLPDGWIFGFDVSAAQGVVNVPAIMAAGCSWLHVRATDGLRDVDAQAHATVRACVDRALPYGLYDVLEPYGEAQAAAQAAHFLTVARECGGSLPPMVDFELSAGRSAVDLLTSAVTWCDVVEQALGSSPIVYASPGFLLALEKLGGGPALARAAKLARWRVWLADYGAAGATPAQNLARGGPRVPAP